MSSLSIIERPSYVRREKVRVGELISRLYLMGFEPAYAYAILDDAVALGRYDSGVVQLGLHREVHPLDSARYLQELRIFNENFEFRAIRVEEEFRCRLRIDDQRQDETDQVFTLDETHKLWGAAREGADDNGWSLLQSNRGTQLYFPGIVRKHNEKGFVVRSYLEFADYPPVARDVEEPGGNLVRFVDERLVSFVDWDIGIGERREQDAAEA
jgi:CRISPR-associated protein (TIGR03984 family)